MKRKTNWLAGADQTIAIHPSTQLQTTVNALIEDETVGQNYFRKAADKDKSTLATRRASYSVTASSRS
jgi:uncharacterized protein (UPF0147 family)